MTVADLPSENHARGARMHALITELYPICRSITGDGLRRTLNRIGQEIELQRTQIPSGTPVLDWTIPDEWNIESAQLRDTSGQVVVDFADHSLHVLNYSEPWSGTISRSELDDHLFSLPDQPYAIPYRTSYYQRQWGFCLSHATRLSLADDHYEVDLRSRLEPGHLDYGECIVPGSTTDEILFSIHCCHPSLANDNLSGISVAIELAKLIADRSSRRYTYRFIFAPGTIGAIAWLDQNRETLGRIKAGLVLTNLGDEGPFHYKLARTGPTIIDRAVGEVLRDVDGEGEYEIRPYQPYGYDERQYCSPGFDLPVGRFTRTPWGEYPEYHTSGDNLSLVRPERLADSVDRLAQIVDALEQNRRYINREPYGEPQLGRRGLYEPVGGQPLAPEDRMAMLWVLDRSDGATDLLEIADQADLPFAAIAAAASRLEAAELLGPADTEDKGNSD